MSEAAESPGNPPIRVAIAGLGKMGIMHASMISAIPGAEVAALVDHHANLGRQVASMLGKPAPHFQSIEECLAAIKPDGVIVSTPQFAHRAVAEACIRAGVGVFCEKPLAQNLAEAAAMADLAAHHPQIPAGIGFMLGHHPLFEKAAILAREGIIGRVISARASCYLSQVFAPNQGWTFTKSKAGGGVVINSGSHLLFVLNRILGPVKGVISRGSPVHNEVEDTFAAMVDFAGGAWGTVDISWSVPGYEFQTHDLRIEGTNGTIEVGNEILRLWLIEAAGGFSKGWTQMRRSEVEPRAALSLSPDYCGDEFYLEDLDFVSALREKRQPKIGWDQGLEIQRLLDALYRSMESGTYMEIRR
ncbi:Gfo/Idh/MocA family oxidoreductase [Candidatus Sumerlaeota bacterium]|nr:Gfo/Idh/MocA family oxidoreductase [Candidatus Sumerlaeota bacterium]